MEETKEKYSELGEEDQELLATNAAEREKLACWIEAQRQRTVREPSLEFRTPLYRLGPTLLYFRTPAVWDPLPIWYPPAVCVALPIWDPLQIWDPFQFGTLFQFWIPLLFATPSAVFIHKRVYVIVTRESIISFLKHCYCFHLFFPRLEVISPFLSVTCISFWCIDFPCLSFIRWNQILTFFQVFASTRIFDFNSDLILTLTRALLLLLILIFLCSGYVLWITFSISQPDRSVPNYKTFDELNIFFLEFYS